MQLTNASNSINALYSEANCIQYFKKLRWKNGVDCPFCQSKHIYEFSDGERFKCKECKKIFSVKVGSIFENSRLPLIKWFKAIQILVSHPEISTVKLAEQIGTTQKTAWFMVNKLRENNIVVNYLLKS